MVTTPESATVCLQLVQRLWPQPSSQGSHNIRFARVDAQTRMIFMAIGDLTFGVVIHSM